jgi:hypothetical protein
MSLNTDKINLKKAEETFAILEAIDHIKQSPLRIVTYAEILAYVTGYSAVDMARVEQEINQNLKTRRTYQNILSKQRTAYIPLLRTAAEGDVDERSGEGFSLKWRASKSQPDQIFVILKISKGIELKGRAEIILHITAKDQHYRLTFPLSKTDKSQIILAADNPIIAALQATNTELSLI